MKQKLITLLLLFLLIATTNRFRQEISAKLDQLTAIKELFFDKPIGIISGFDLKVSI